VELTGCISAKVKLAAGTVEVSAAFVNNLIRLAAAQYAVFHHPPDRRQTQV